MAAGGGWRGRELENCGLSLPYDGIIRTGSRGLSQLHRSGAAPPTSPSKLLELRRLGKADVTTDVTARRSGAKKFGRFDKIG